jgi:DNA invertase Pin-like site-specific DNA recombinase
VRKRCTVYLIVDCWGSQAKQRGLVDTLLLQTPCLELFPKNWPGGRKMPNSTIPSPLVPAAQYVRMSTDLQQYSIENQKAAIARYAEEHGFVVTETYADEGRSGILLQRRGALTALLKDVLSGNAGYKAILVYDVSRWGRFQDTDEAAHYEFLCKNAGIPIHYCAELFPNDGTLPSSIFKVLKRAMAAEYSRELSVKVSRAQLRLAGLGFRMGGIPGYGLRRLLVSTDETRIQKLETGQRKSLAIDHVVLIPGPKKEVKCVRAIFAMALRSMNMTDIARSLNHQHTPYLAGRRWTSSAVGRTLTNPKYAGVHIYNRISCKLHTPPVPVPVEQWIIKRDAFTPVIDRSIFDRVQRTLNKRKEKTSKEELLRSLRHLLHSKGKLTQNLIKESPTAPTISTLFYRAGRLREVYKLVGYSAPPGTFTKVDSRTRTYKLRAQLFSQIAALFPQHTSAFRQPGRMRSILRLDNDLCISVMICPCFRSTSGKLRWKLNPVPSERSYMTLLCRLNRENTDFESFYMLPSIDRLRQCSLEEDDPWLAKAKRIELFQIYETAKTFSLTP